MLQSVKDKIMLQLFVFEKITRYVGLGLGLFCLTPLSIIFQLHVYHGGQFY
jgi:hypothetical protein